MRRRRLFAHRAQRSVNRRRWTRGTAAVVGLLLAIGAVTAVWAYFSAAGAGTGSATTGTLAAPTGVGTTYTRLLLDSAGQLDRNYESGRRDLRLLRAAFRGIDAQRRMRNIADRAHDERDVLRHERRGRDLHVQSDRGLQLVDGDERGERTGHGHGRHHAAERAGDRRARRRAGLTAARSRTASSTHRRGARAAPRPRRFAARPLTTPGAAGSPRPSSR